MINIMAETVSIVPKEAIKSENKNIAKQGACVGRFRWKRPGLSCQQAGVIRDASRAGKEGKCELHAPKLCIVETFLRGEEEINSPLWKYFEVGRKQSIHHQ